MKVLTFLLYTTLLSIYGACNGQNQEALDCKGKHQISGNTCGKQQTMLNEGERLCCYHDSKGIPTIGFGFNLENPDAAQVMSNHGLNLSDVLQDCKDQTKNHCLTDADARDIFNTVSYPIAEQCVDGFVPGLPQVVRAAIIDMAFMGCNKLNKFIQLKKELLAQNWVKAAGEIANSKWCLDVGLNRCCSNYNCVANYKGCTGQTCGTYTSCSSTTNCHCYKASNGSGFCAQAESLCSTYPDCSSCPSSTSVCVIDSCCQRPICVPLAAGQNCKTSPTGHISKSNHPADLKRSVCQRDQDCTLGKLCKRHLTGDYCV